MEHFKCSLCLELLDSPITTPCQHSFCRDCLVQQVRNSRRGPLCRSHLPQPQFRRSSIRDQPSNPVITAAMQQFMNECGHTGCSYKTLPRKIELHETECLFRVVTCINDGCEEVMTAGEMRSHAESCRFTRCNAYPYGCDVFGSKEELSTHVSTCRFTALSLTIGKVISDTVKREVEEALHRSNPARVALSAASGLINNINSGGGTSLRIPGNMFLDILRQHENDE